MNKKEFKDESMGCVGLNKYSFNENKNAKNEKNICKIVVNDANNTQKHIKTVSNNDLTELSLYVKVLLDAYRSIPKIIGIIDRMIESKASTISYSNVYGSSYETYSQVDKLISMGERKNKLLNLYVMIEEMLKSLNDIDRKILILKFVRHDTVNEIAEEINLTERSVYRKIIKIVNNLALFMIEKNWGVNFIKNQLGDEPWLTELYNKKKKEDLVNIKRGNR